MAITTEVQPLSCIYFLTLRVESATWILKCFLVATHSRIHPVAERCPFRLSLAAPLDFSSSPHLHTTRKKLWPDQHKINWESLVVSVVSVALARSVIHRRLLISFYWSDKKQSLPRFFREIIFLMCRFRLGKSIISGLPGFLTLPA